MPTTAKTYNYSYVIPSEKIHSQPFLDDFCLTLAYYRFYLFNRGFFDAFHALEVGEQGLLGLGAGALDVVECRGGLPLAALIAVEGDGKAVYLVLYAFE